jgi:hypothetical protein
VFYTAQGIIRARARRYTDEELIDRLRGLYRHRGFLSGLVIDESEGMPSASVYVHRFGSLIRAYQMVGYTPDRDYRFLEINRFLRRTASGDRRTDREADRQPGRLGGPRSGNRPAVGQPRVLGLGGAGQVPDHALR